MDDLKYKGIVLAARDHKEKDKLVTLFTLEQGKITALLKGVKAPKAKLAFAAQLFCFGEFLLVTRLKNFNFLSRKKHRNMIEV